MNKHIVYIIHSAHRWCCKFFFLIYHLFFFSFKVWNNHKLIKTLKIQFETFFESFESNFFIRRTHTHTHTHTHCISLPCLFCLLQPGLDPSSILNTHDLTLLKIVDQLFCTMSISWDLPNVSPWLASGHSSSLMNGCSILLTTPYKVASNFNLS